MITEAMAEESLSEVDRLTLSLTGKAMKNSQLCRPEYRDQIDRWCLPTVCKFVSRNILCTREYGHRILYVDTLTLLCLEESKFFPD